jgi:hypothetical protein
MDTVPFTPDPGKSRRENYYLYLESPAWAAKRQQVIERAGNKCQLCASTKKLNTHHNTYKNLFAEPLTDLACLCRRCHKKFHRIGEPRETAKRFVNARIRAKRVRKLQGLIANKRDFRPIPIGGMFAITKRLIESLRTPAGGFRKETICALGVEWPPRSGWARRLKGTLIPQSVYERAREFANDPAPIPH